VDLTDIM